VTARARLADLTILVIAEEQQLQATLRAELGKHVRELRTVANSQEATKVLARWRPSAVVWRTGVPTLHDIALARDIQNAAVQPPHIVYMHDARDVGRLLERLERLAP